MTKMKMKRERESIGATHDRRSEAARACRRLICALCLAAGAAFAAPPAVTYPPTLPDGRELATDKSPDFLKPTGALSEGVTIAQTPPAIDFLYYPGQDYPGNPWSVWGNGSAVQGKYFSAIGDHQAPAGNAFIFEYDAGTKKLRRLMDTRSLLALPEGHYAPGKIHSRVDLGSDGWLYFSTHRGSTRVTTDQYHYLGDWVLRCNPTTGASEIVMHAPVPKHCIPTSILDPQRLIFYGGTAPGSGGDEEGIQFFACDVRAKKLIYSGSDGPARCIALAKSTGRVYFTPGKGEGLVRFDPAKPGAPERIETPAAFDMRWASAETKAGLIYTVSNGQSAKEAQLFAFNTRTEKIEPLGPAAVASQQYITSLEIDPAGRYLYYIPGAHGGADRDGTAVVQFDTQTRHRKVIAFLHPFYQSHYGCALKGTYSAALDPNGERLYVTWNANRGSKNWDTCALTVIHIPESERGR